MSGKDIYILLAEDNLINQKVIEAFCNVKKWKVDVADNGIEVLAKLNEGEYDLILMDVQMPEMTGLEATEEIRKNPRWDHVPIIALTAHSLDDDRDQLLKVGMSDYLRKPVDFNLLEEMVNRYAGGR